MSIRKIICAEKNVRKCKFRVCCPVPYIFIISLYKKLFLCVVGHGVGLVEDDELVALVQERSGISDLLLMCILQCCRSI